MKQSPSSGVEAQQLILDPEFTWGSCQDVRNKALEFVNDRLSPKKRNCFASSTVVENGCSTFMASRRKGIEKASTRTIEEVKKTARKLQQPRNVLHRSVHYVSKGLTDAEAILIGDALHSNVLLQELNLNGNQIGSEGSLPFVIMHRALISIL